MILLSPELNIKIYFKTKNHWSESLIVPPIGLEYPKKSSLSRGDYVDIQFQEKPWVSESPKLILNITYFSRLTHEEYIRFRRKFEKAIKGNKCTYGYTKYELVRRMLQVDSLEKFEIAYLEAGYQTNTYFFIALEVLRDHIFLNEYLHTQKLYTSRFLRKTKVLNVRQ